MTVCLSPIPRYPRPIAEALTPAFEASADDVRLVEALRRGDEQAFRLLLERYNGSLLRLALTYVRNRAVAEEVVQETWLAVIRGVDRFEARSSLKTWIFRILTNTAKTRGERESRTVPFSAFAAAEDEPAVDPKRFLDAGHPRWPGHWASPPSSWDDVPEARLLSGETRARIEAAIAELPPMQRRVIALRDVEGLSGAEVCDLLELSEANQRVLLHRARARVRRALEEYLG